MVPGELGVEVRQRVAIPPFSLLSAPVHRAAGGERHARLIADGLGLDSDGRGLAHLA